MITKEYLQQELAKRINGYKRGVKTSTDNIIAEIKSILVLVDALPDYENKYNEALKQAKIAYKDTDRHLKATIERIFPELRKSDDERMRELIIDRVRSATEMTEGLRELLLTYFKKQKEQKPAVKQDYSGLNDFERAIHRGFLVAGVENVPVTIIKETAQDCIAHMPTEWSKEDEMYLSQAIETLEHENYLILAEKLKSLRPQVNSIVAVDAEQLLKLLPQKQKWSEKDKEMLRRCIATIPVQGDEITPTSYLNKLRNWLESLPERFNLQPNQEWSEEDKETLEKLHRLLIICRGEKKFIQEVDYNKMDNLLKSLSPQPKVEWSEEDEKNLGQVISGRYLPLGLREWFCGLPERFSSRPSWKPSEEQIRALWDAYKGGKEQEPLRELIEQLKKL